MWSTSCSTSSSWLASCARSASGSSRSISPRSSQILLYTVFRAWIVDVPEAFARTPEEIAYLDSLVAFHGVTLVLVSLALLVQRFCRYGATPH